MLAALVVLVLAATAGSSLIQQRGDRERRMTDVLGTAFKIYNPGYDIEVRDWGATTPLSISFTVAARPMRAVGGFVANFRRWVGMLKDYDADNLHDFDLSLARLRKAANDGLAYAYVDSLATIGGTAEDHRGSAGPDGPRSGRHRSRTALASCISAGPLASP